MDKRLLWIGTVGLCFTVAALLRGMNQQERVKERNAFMQLKLANAQLVLGGVATGEFAQIEEGASNLVRLSKKAEFQMRNVPDYERHSEDFRRAAEALSQAAKNRSSDAAALAYLDLARSCVKCHQHIRDVK